MDSFEKQYKVKGWHGDTHSLTAKALYERVLKDSKSDYNWIASATELVKVCNDPCFPEMYAIGIKVMILNCCANLELKKEYPINEEVTDEEAIYSCYNYLPSTDDTAKKAKEKYLTAVITGITKYTTSEVRFPIHNGTTYKQKVEEWKKAKFDEYVSATEIDFDQLRKDLYDDFDRMVKTAEEEGAFEKDDEEHREEMNKNMASLFALIDSKDLFIN